MTTFLTSNNQSNVVRDLEGRPINPPRFWATLLSHDKPSSHKQLEQPAYDIP